MTEEPRRHRSHSKPRPTHDRNHKSKPSSKSHRKEHATPFDEKGRCHHHKGVQMATKKMGGGWKVLIKICPKCMEDSYTDANDDDRSVRSGRSERSSKSNKAKEYREKYDKDYSTLGSLANKLEKPYDGNGCCRTHAHIQIAKKKVLGGWKVVRECPACAGGEDIGLDDDRLSVCSGKSGKSAKSNRSNRSAKSGKKSKERSHNPTQSGRYGSLPFDAEGYCCQHPSVRIAKKKTMGGWKILFDICPDCQAEGLAGGGKGGRRRSLSRSRQRSRSRARNDDDDGDGDTASVSSRGKRKDSEGDGGTTSKPSKKKVKNLKTRDETGCPGRYTGYVNEEYRPNGKGVMVYENGMEWEGVWKNGVQKEGGMRGHKSNF